MTSQSRLQFTVWRCTPPQLDRVFPDRSIDHCARNEECIPHSDTNSRADRVERVTIYRARRRDFACAMPRASKMPALLRTVSFHWQKCQPSSGLPRAKLLYYPWPLSWIFLFSFLFFFFCFLLSLFLAVARRAKATRLLDFRHRGENSGSTAVDFTDV